MKTAMTDKHMGLRDHVKMLHDVPEHFLEMTTADLFAISPADVDAIQFSLLRRRFAELRPKIEILDRLATKNGITEITRLEDLAKLGLPHTVYKSYSIDDIEHGRYDRLTKWLSTLSAYDLSNVDVSGCDSIESWILRVEAASPIRPISSSGTTGKISILPRGLPEDAPQLHLLVRAFEPYGNEPGIDIRGGDVPLLLPWPVDSGRQSLGYFTQLLRGTLYAERKDLVKTFAKGRVTADELSLASRLKRAETLGEELKLTKAEKETAQRVNQRLRDLPAHMESFVEDAVVKLKGQRVLVFGLLQQIYQLAVICKERGIRSGWSPESVIVTSGGTKGFTFPEGWRETLNEVFPFPLKDNYGMSETTSGGLGCSHGHYHPLPWGINILVDPETGEPLPRSGIQTGRLLVFDLLASSFWAATLSGDLVTINFDGGCGCGREGIYFKTNIARLSAAQGGSDKITSGGMIHAFEKLEEVISSFVAQAPQ